MKLRNILNELLNTDAVSVQELQNINKNILIYVKTHEQMNDKIKKEFIESLTDMLLSVSKKIPGKDKYERFIAKLASDNDKIDTMLKIVDYNNKLIKEKTNENPQATTY